MSGKLTAREEEVLLRIYSGASNREIAEDMGISSDAAKTYMVSIFKKIGAGGRLEATRWAENNLLRSDGHTIH